MGSYRALRRVAAITSAFLLLTAANAFAYWGDLDRSFKDGKVQTSFASLLRSNSTQGNGDIAQEVISLPNGDLFVAGTVDSNSNGTAKQHGLALYKKDGCPVTTFGTNGIRATGDYFDFDAQTTVVAAARQSNGKVVVLGGPELTIARYNEDGTYDTSFGDQGMISYATPPLPSNPANGDTVVHRQDLRVADVAIDEFQGGRRIIVVGNLQRQTLQYSSDTSMWNTVGSVDTDLAVFALTEAGSPDPDWSTGGVPLHVRERDGDIAGLAGKGIQIDVSALDLARGVAIDSSRKIVVLARAHHWDDEMNDVTNNQDFTVLRMTTAGSLDSTWNGIGLKQLDMSNFDEPDSVVVQSSGRVVIGGTYFTNSLTQNFMLGGFTTTGVLDMDFSGDGKVEGEHYGAGGAAKAQATSLALMSNDKLVIGGYTLNHSPSTHDEFALGYYQANGTTISGNKVPLVPSGTHPWDRSYGSAVQANDQVVLVGGSGSASGDTQPLLNSKFQLVRLQGENPTSPAVTIGDATVTEGNSGTSNVNVPVTLSTASTCDVSFTYQTDWGSAIGDDFTAASGTHTIPAGQTTSNIQVSAVGDTTDESNEYFQLIGSNVEYARGVDLTSEITITDDDGGTPPPTNNAPELTEIGDQFFDEGEEIDLQLQATDEDGDDVTFMMTDGPDDATFSADGAFSWTPDYNDAGQYLTTFIVTDEHDDSDSEQLTITITNVKLETTTTVGITKTPDFIKVSGEVNPDNPGDEMAVKLFKKKAGKWKQVGATKSPSLKDNSTYATKFARPGGGSYKVTATYLGDFDHKKSAATKTFSL